MLWHMHLCKCRVVIIHKGYFESHIETLIEQVVGLKRHILTVSVCCSEQLYFVKVKTVIILMGMSVPSLYIESTNISTANLFHLQ